MPLRAKIRCQHFGCPELVSQDAKVCERHAADHSRRKFDKARQSDWLRKERQTAHWAHFRKWFLMLNPICQRLRQADGDKWIRCQNIATLLHHRVDPRGNRDVMYDASKIVGLCTDCHHGHQGDIGTERYLPTNTGDGASQAA